MFRNLKILLFSHSSHLAGAERCLLELVQQLVSQFDCECLVVLPSEGPLAGLLQKAQAQTLICSLPWWTYTGNTENADASESTKTRLAVSYPRLLDIIPALEAFDPDIIVSNTAVIPWGATASTLLGKPHVWLIHEYIGTKGNIFPPCDFRTFISEILEASNRIIVCSNHLKEALFSAADDSIIHTVHPSIDVPAFDFTEPEKSDIIKIGMFTSIQPHKGQLDAIKAVETLLKKGYQVSLLLAGYRDRSYGELIDRYIEENNLTQSIKQTKFILEPFQTMASMDILISCSRFEAFGRYPVESLLLGKPVVYSNVGGPREYLEDTVTGLAYTPGNYIELSDKLRHLIDNPSEAKAIAQCGQRMAKDRFAGKKYAKQIISIMQEALRDKKKAKIPNFVLHAISERMVRDSNELRRLDKELKTQELLERELKSVKDESEDLKKALSVAERRRILEHRRMKALSETVLYKNKEIKDIASMATQKERALTQKLVEADSMIERCKMKIASLETSIEGLTRKLEAEQNEFAQRVDRFKEQLRIAESEIIARDKTLASLETEMKILREQLETEKASTATLHEVARLKDAQILSLEEKNKVLVENVYEISSVLSYESKAYILIAQKSASRTAKDIAAIYVKSLLSALKHKVPIQKIFAVKSSVLFDETSYLEKNPDVARAKMCPAAHYLMFGGFEGRDPSVLFSSTKYLETYSDVKTSGVNPLVHYEMYGKKEGRAIFPT